MIYSIKRLTSEYEKSYTSFLLQHKESLMYYSLQFREFLSELLEDPSDYLIAVDDKENVVGCMPVFYRRDDSTGIIANSLPYYGGHGGVLADDDSVRRAILNNYMETVKEKKCVASTIVGSPLENFDALYKEVVKPDYIDERIELMTYFPYESGLSYGEALMNIYHYKERNSIRKAQKNGVEILIDNSWTAMEFLHQVHTENMYAVKGIPKSKKCFELIQRHFRPGQDYDIYIALKDTKKIAAMLIFYYNGTVEYYTPAILSEYRTIQPLTLLIFTAMQNAMEKGLEKWNWGGTGLNQKSLYDFKSKWGTTESRYYYYTRIFDDQILQVRREQLMTTYANYYVYPFSQV